MTDLSNCKCGFFMPGPLHARDCSHYDDYVKRNLAYNAEKEEVARRGELDARLTKKIELALEASSFRIRKSFGYEAAHQLEAAYTKACSDCIHGHSYLVELIVGGDLGPNDMVLDFGELAEFKAQVMSRWDHALILHEAKRPIYEPLIAAGHLKREKVFFSHMNPTAEAMAKTLFVDLRVFLTPMEVRARASGWVGEFPRVECVRVHETSTGWAEYSE